MAEELKKDTVTTGVFEEKDAEAVNSDHEIKEGDASPLESFLNREQEQKPPKKPMKKSRKTALIIVGAVAVIAILVAVLIFVRKQPAPDQPGEHTAAELSLDVNADGVHEANVDLDENGKIKQDGSGKLLDYATAKIKKIDVENQNGSFTVTSSTSGDQATVYTLVGFEKYDMQKGVADEIATNTASLVFKRVIAVKAKLADYGLEKSRATVKAQFDDNTSAIIRVGDEAAGGEGVYLSFGTSDTVYLVESDVVSPYLYSVNELISLDITAVNEDSDNAEFSTLTISGTHYPEPITLVPNKDEAIEAAYLVTSPVSLIANAVEASDIAGNVRGLYAESVLCVNPSADQLASYGLSEPYATVEATYPDTSITLHASAPDDSGIVNVLNPEQNVIYTIQLAAVCWAKTDIDLLLPENPLPAKLRYVDQIDFTAGGTDLSINVTTTTETYTDDNGNEQESYNSTAVYNGKDLNTDDFTVFFQNLTSMKTLGKADTNGRNEIMSATLRYTTDRADDILTVLSSGATNYVLSLNGAAIGTVSKAYIDSLIEGAANLAAGKAVEGL